MDLKDKLAFPHRYNEDTDLIFNICNDLTSKFTIFEQGLLSVEDERLLSRNQMNTQLTVFFEEELRNMRFAMFPERSVTELRQKRCKNVKRAVKPPCKQFSGMSETSFAQEFPKRLEFSRGERRYVDRSADWRSLESLVFEGTL